MDKEINVTRSSMPDFYEYVNEIKDLWDSRWLTNMGKEYKKLELLLQDYLQVNSVQLLVNGHMALELAFQSLLQPGGEVITTPYTFVSTTNAIIRSGLKPVFCDVNKSDFTIDVSQIERLINKKTVAIVPVHVYGNICDVQAIEEIANKYGLKVIYDAAHALGETINGCGVANYGDASCFSFHATKVFHTIEGGAVCSNNFELTKKIKIMSDFGIDENDTFAGAGTNAKINEFAAAMGVCNLKHLDENIIKRKDICNLYRERLQILEGLQLNCIQPNVKSNYAYFPIIVDESKVGFTRDQLMEALRKKRINTRKYFYPLTTEVISKNLKHHFLNAYYLSERVLTLPLYADLELNDVNYICDEIVNLYKAERNSFVR